MKKIEIIRKTENMKELLFSSNLRYSHCSSLPLLPVVVLASVSISLSFQE
jgi:hypothetical protein